MPKHTAIANGTDPVQQKAASDANAVQDGVNLVAIVGCFHRHLLALSRPGIKDMEETAHPYYYSCPLKYLNMVPIDRFGGNAKWREEVIAHHQRRAEKRRQKAAAKA